MKKCSKCKELKSLDCFNIQKSKYNTGQLHHHCKTCIKKADRIRYEKNKDRLKQQAKPPRTHLLWQALSLLKVKIIKNYKIAIKPKATKPIKTRERLVKKM